MNQIFDKIDEIALDAKQAHQIRSMFRLGFLSGMAFKDNIPNVDPSSGVFENAYQIFLIATGEEAVKTYNQEMKAFEKGEPTELGNV